MRAPRAHAIASVATAAAAAAALLLATASAATPLNDVASAPRDCSALKRADPSAVSGVYYIDPNGGNVGDAVLTYCDQSTAGGGWTLISSNAAADATYSTGTNRVGEYTFSEGMHSEPSTTTDYAMGPQVLALRFDEARIFSERGGGSSDVLDIAWAHDCLLCGVTNNVGIMRTLPAHNVANVGCGGCKNLNLDAQWVERENSNWDSNANQRGVGGVCTGGDSSADPAAGTLIGHGIGEGSGHNGEGNYYEPSGQACSAYDFATYTTWVRSEAIPLNTPSQALPSCSHIIDADPDAPSGPYYIDSTPDNGYGDAVVAQCDMETQGGGWTLVGSNYGGDDFFNVGTARQNDFLFVAAGPRSSVWADWHIGPQLLNMPFTEARLRSDRYGDGSAVIDFAIPTTCGPLCVEENNWQRMATLPGHNVENVGCGHVATCTLDGAWAEEINHSIDSNANQRTIGLVCTQTSGDPVTGTYIGHGVAEASWPGEGNYIQLNAGTCGAADFMTYSTWVRNGNVPHNTRAAASKSCSDIWRDDPDAPDGVYWVNPDGGTTTNAVKTYCQGGWTLVASNYALDDTFSAGVDREDLFVFAAGYNANPSPFADYHMGPQALALVFDEARIMADKDADGASVLDMAWPVDCIKCYAEDNFELATFLPDHNIDNPGCGHAKDCNVDGMWAEGFDPDSASNANQRTVGGVCTQQTPDPASGTYIGHGAEEGGTHDGEGVHYEVDSACAAVDFRVYTTWVRGKPAALNVKPAGDAIAGAPVDCAAIKRADPQALSGIYWIVPAGDAEGAAPIRAYCDQATDGGGWTLVSSNAAADETFPQGVDRQGDYVFAVDAPSQDPSIRSDYNMGPPVLDLDFDQVRVLADKDGDATVVADIVFPLSCVKCLGNDNFAAVRELPGTTPGLNIGCGHPVVCSLDGQWADMDGGDGEWNSNANQRTVGAVCTQASGDPFDGVYVGHGANEATSHGEGLYMQLPGAASCQAHDTAIFATFVRPRPAWPPASESADASADSVALKVVSPNGEVEAGMHILPDNGGSGAYSIVRSPAKGGRLHVNQDGKELMSISESGLDVNTALLAKGRDVLAELDAAQRALAAANARIAELERQVEGA